REVSGPQQTFGLDQPDYKEDSQHYAHKHEKQWILWTRNDGLGWRQPNQCLIEAWDEVEKDRRRVGQRRNTSPEAAVRSATVCDPCRQQNNKRQYAQRV